MSPAAEPAKAAQAVEARNGSLAPRVGFVGLGWIGQQRMQAIRASGAIEVAVLADPSPQALHAAQLLAPEARLAGDLPTLLEADLDALVIATPNALHAPQALAAFDRRLAVFCQKPLGRNRGEVADVVAAARRADRRLSVDLSYRYTRGMRAIHALVTEGALGDIYAVDLVFHNAYGPDKAWFYDIDQSGGGCVMDLGVHLIDLALWMLCWPAVSSVSSQLYAGGHRLRAGEHAVEDYALATLGLASGAVVRLACSWKSHAGHDCVIEATFHGTRAGASFRNVGGSFYDFRAELLLGTSRHLLAEPPDDWGGAALCEWARKLRADRTFDPDADALVEVAGALDRIYGRA